MALKKGKPLSDWAKAAPGRPKSNLGDYIVKSVSPDRSKTGFEMLNNTPAAIEAAKKNYLDKFQLPPALAPKYITRPEVQDRQRRKHISDGWIKPRSPAG